MTTPSRHRSVSSRSVLYLLVIVGAFVALLLFAQHSLIYHPRRYADGFERLLPAGTMQLEYRTDAGKQLAFYLPPRSGAALPRNVWVTFSGNASVALDWLVLAERSRARDDAFLLIDYPGYGRSEGRASIASTRASADRAITTLAERLQISGDELRSRLNVVGLSLGAAAALRFAGDHPVHRVALIAPFTTLREVAAALFTRPISWLLLENYDNRARIAELALRNPPPRVAIFHGTADTLIPATMGRELAESAPEIVEFFPIEGGTHDTVFSVAADQIVAWMSR
jgi:pimeloyl-ACP methyl ester carboxylesterase